MSIVTPSYNSVRFIEEAIQSVLIQDYPYIEQLVIDGGSTDGTIELLKQYPRLRWISEPDEGQADALNKGFRMARGEIIGWLNADDTYTVGAVKAAVQCLVSHPEVSIVYSDCNWIDNQGKPMGKYRAQEYSLHALAEKAGLIHTPAVFWRRSLFEAVGYLNVQYHYSLDNDFWLRACPLANPLHIDYTLANYRRSPGSKTMSRETEFCPELVHIYTRVLKREPYRSGLSASEKQLIVGRLYWISGIVMCQNGQAERAQPYLKMAVEEHDILSFGSQAIYPIILHFLEGRPLPRGMIRQVLAHLPLPPDRLVVFEKAVWQEYHATRFFLAHSAGDWQAVRNHGLWVLANRPRWLGHRGFMSIWLESLLGSRISKMVRRLV